MSYADDTYMDEEESVGGFLGNVLDESTDEDGEAGPATGAETEEEEGYE